MDRGKLYQELFEAYKIVMNGRSAREAQEAAICTWNSYKTETKDNQGELERRIKDIRTRSWNCNQKDVSGKLH